MSEWYAEATEAETPVVEDELIQLVGFKMGKELFGVDILLVQEIIREAEITPIPNSPASIEGVINLRGNIIPIIDLRKRLNLLQDSDQDHKMWVLIFTLNGKVTGFIVDSVSRIFKIRKNAIKPPPDIVAAGLKSQYINGVCKLDAGLLVLLDFDRILSVDEIRQLEEI